MNEKNRFEWDFLSKSSSLSKAKIDDKRVTSSRVAMIPISVIEPNPLQPRRNFDEVATLSLADSIRRHGLLQPILVKRIGKGFYEKPRYYCVSGERRLRAYKMLSRQAIPCLVLSPEICGADELAVLDSLMHKDYDMFEYARAFSFLCETYRLTQEELATLLSTSQTNVSNKFRLLLLTPEEQDVVLLNDLTERHVLALLRIQDVMLRKKVCELVAERQYSVKRTEEYIDAILSEPIAFVQTDTDNDEVEVFASSLNRTLTLLRKKGVAVQVETFDHEDEIQFLIRVPKK